MTIGQWLEQLQDVNSSSEEDTLSMQSLLRHRLGFNQAVVILGVVYLDGHGTMANPPRSIQSVAKSLLHSIRKEQSV